jgi:fatty acid desaturase
MIDLTPGMFVTPVIALTGVVSLYVFFLKRTRDRSFRRFVGWSTVLAFLLNFIWELGHFSLYRGFAYDLPHVAFLGLASLADTIMVGLLYFGFAFIYRDGGWIQHLTVSRTTWLIGVGGLGAAVSEMAHLSADNWAYTDRMPLIFGIGLTPLLQFSLLPLVIYWLSLHLTRRNAVVSARGFQLPGQL